RLRGDARPAAALAAHELALHERDPPARGAQDPDGVLPCRAAADDHHVVALGHGARSYGLRPASTATPSVSSRRAMPRLAAAFHGSNFSPAIRVATITTHATLITPSAHSAAISAQQHPPHHA